MCVYAILAGASWCERGETQREDMGIAIDAAGVLMEEQAPRSILKVLMTSPVRSRVVAKCVPVEGTVSRSGRIKFSIASYSAFQGADHVLRLKKPVMVTLFC